MKTVHIEEVKKIVINTQDINQSLKKNEELIRESIDNYCNSNPSKGQVMKEIIGFIQDNLDKANLSKTYISEKFGMSISSINRNLKSFTGMTYLEILNMMRLKKMLELLNEGNMKDREIGEIIGISDPHYLSIWFKKMTGNSVTNYRKSI